MMYRKILAVMLIGGVLSFIYAQAQRFENDVGVDSIISPGYYWQGPIMTPVAQVKNYGTNSQSFVPVVCSIIGANDTLRYTGTQTIGLLAAGDIVRVTFSSWTPTMFDSLIVIMRTNLAGDENPSNDRMVRITHIVTDMIVEGFNDTIFPPPGWQSVIVQGTYNWCRGDTGPYPPTPPYEGAGMACYPSFYAPAGSQARLITPLITPTSPWRCTLKFYMYHDPAYPGTFLDSVKIETSTDGINFTRVAAFRRYEATASWTEHVVYLGNFSVPFYVGFLGFSGHGYNINIDYVRLTTFSGIEEDKINNIPLITILNSPKPNPITNGLTHLSFSLAEPSQILMKIYNTSGRLVKTLVNEFKSAGFYNVNWDCRDELGRRVTKGIYFYTLETPKQKFTNKLVLFDSE